MDPSPTPWRVLEDPATPGLAGAPSERTAAPVRVAALSRATVVILGCAAALAVAAFAIASSGGSSGAVSIEGGAPLGSATPRASAGAGAATAPGSGRLLIVEIVGAVDHPGVFRLPGDARVGDLIAAAGGYGPRVDADRAGRVLNLAAPLHDGDQVRVPSRDDGASSAPGTGPEGSPPPGGPGAPASPIDLNRATATELDTLPGVGPATATKIIASRDAQAFASVDDLRSRKLVGEKTFEKLKDLVTVR